MGGRLSRTLTQRQPDEEVLLDLKLKQNQSLNAQEGTQTEENTEGKLSEDFIVPRLQSLVILIEKENEVTKEFRDLMQSIPQNEVSLTTGKYHEIENEYSSDVLLFHLLTMMTYQIYQISTRMAIGIYSLLQYAIYNDRAAHVKALLDHG